MADEYVGGIVALSAVCCDPLPRPLRAGYPFPEHRKSRSSKRTTTCHLHHLRDLDFLCYTCCPARRGSSFSLSQQFPLRCYKS